MCGFGPRTGARTLAEIGDPHRFANPGRLAAYAGLAPVDRQSGRSHTTGRSRGGNHRVGNAMFIAAFVATQHDPDARAYYLRKRAQGKEHTHNGMALSFGGHLRRPPTPQHHPGHAQNPNPLPTTPDPTRNPQKPTRRGLTTRQGHPPYTTRMDSTCALEGAESPPIESRTGQHPVQRTGYAGSRSTLATLLDGHRN